MFGGILFQWTFLNQHFTKLFAKAAARKKHLYEKSCLVGHLAQGLRMGWGWGMILSERHLHILSWPEALGRTIEVPFGFPPERCLIQQFMWAAKVNGICEAVGQKFYSWELETS